MNVFEVCKLLNILHSHERSRNLLSVLGPKYDNAQPSYPGFERDVFKTVSDYFYSLLQPLLTYELYELFINVLGRYCGLIPSG